MDMLADFIKKGSIINTKYGPSIVKEVNTFGIVTRNLGIIQKNQYLSWPDVRLRMSKGQIVVPGLEELSAQTKQYRGLRAKQFI